MLSGLVSLVREGFDFISGLGWRKDLIPFGDHDDHHIYQWFLERSKVVITMIAKWNQNEQYCQGGKYGQ